MRIFTVNRESGSSLKCKAKPVCTRSSRSRIAYAAYVFAVAVVAATSLSAQVAPGPGIVWIQLQGPMETRLGFVETAHHAVGFAEIGVSGGVVRLQRQRLPDAIHREFMAPHLMCDDSQVMPRFRVARRRRQDLTIERLRVAETSGLMMLDCECEGLGNSQRGP